MSSKNHLYTATTTMVTDPGGMTKEKSVKYIKQAKSTVEFEHESISY